MTYDNCVGMQTTADNGLKPEDDLFMAVSIEENSDKLSNRWVFNPGSNTHVINTENWIGWAREYDAVASDLVGAGIGGVQITAWGSMELMAKTPTSVQSLTLTL
jgi:hypothetical protein